MDCARSPAVVDFESAQNGGSSDMSATQEIEARIREFVDDLSVLVRREAIEAARRALEGGAPVRARSNGRRSAKRGRPPGRGAAKGPPPGADAIVAYLKSSPGKRTEEIGRALKRPTDPMKPVLRKLVATGVLRTTGQRRGTKYFVK
jgi:hypothetical protein